MILNSNRHASLLEQSAWQKMRTWHDFEDTYKGFIFSLIVRMGMTQEDAEDIINLC